MSGAAAFPHAASWPERFAVVAVFLVNGVGIGAWAACIPALKASLALSDGELGLVLFVFAAGAVLSMLLAARLSQWVGPAKATRASALVFALTLLLPAFAPNLMALVVAVFVVGAASGLQDVTMNAYASGVERRWGAAIMSSFHAAWSAGGLIGASVGGACVGFGASWPLVAGAALAVALAAGAAPILQDACAASTPPAPGLARPIRAALPLCAAAALCMLCEGAMADWTGVYLAEVASALQAVASIGFAVFSAAMLTCRLLGDSAVRAFGRAAVVRWGATLAAAGLALAVAEPRVATSTVGFALVGVGLSNVVPVVFSAGARLTAMPAVGVAMVATAGYCGYLSGPAIIGAIAQGAGLRLGVAFLILCAAGVVRAGRALSA
jgi:MFS family permease